MLLWHSSEMRHHNRHYSKSAALRREWRRRSQAPRPKQRALLAQRVVLVGLVSVTALIAGPPIMSAFERVSRTPAETAAVDARPSIQIATLPERRAHRPSLLEPPAIGLP